MRFCFARNFFYILTFGVIIFLTGCARGGYHRSALSPPALPRETGWTQASVRQDFIWPIKGEVVFGFGSKEGRVSLKGIVIAAHSGDRVLAARDGRVRLVDQRLKGYGKTVILEHPSGFYTVYARNSEILVTLGQWVGQGEPIAVCGPQTGGKSPQIYFEIRRNAKVEDPLVHLQRN